MAEADWATGQLDFPWQETLCVAVDWIEAHCVIPDGFQKGQPFVLAGWQAFSVGNFYRVKPDAPKDNQLLERPVLAPAFVYRRGQIVLPQKMGKAPFSSAVICLEGVGPALFAGWATGDEAWVCSDHGCHCGWVYEYEPGEAMGMAWPTPLIQITATSEEQTGNIYDALRPMIDDGPLHELIPKTGEEFIRLPNDGRIDVVTSSATSRLGQRVTHAPQDETGLWTPQNKMVKVYRTQQRGLSGMGGRSLGTTNAWDPTVDSVAKRTDESKRPDIFKLHPQPPADLDYKKQADRAKIHAHVYQGSPWVDLNAIEAEALEAIEKDPAEAERFYGNRAVAGSGKAFSLARWLELADLKFVPPPGEWIALGFDGSKFHDSTALIATHVESGYQWPVGIWRPEDFDPLEDGSYEIDESEVTAALEETMARWKVFDCYCDPPYWQDTVKAWSGRWPKRVHEWWTNRPRAMVFALAGYRDAMVAGTVTHNGDAVFAEHIGNAVKVDTKILDDDDHVMWLIAKEAPKSPLKIDAAMAGCLSWEARGAAIEAGVLRKRSDRTIRF